MAYPVVQGRASGATTATNTTSHVVTLPSGVQVGEMLLVAWSCDADPGLSWTAGWRLAWTQAQGVTNSVSIFTKTATGSDALTITTGAAEQSSHVSFRISGASGVFGASGADTVANANPGPNSLKHLSGTSACENLWIAVVGHDQTTVCTAAPSGYTNLTVKAAAGTSGASVSTAEKTSTSPTEDPGAFTSVARSHCWVTLCVTRATPSLAASSLVDTFTSADTSTWTNTNYTVSGGTLNYTSKTTAETATYATRFLYNLTGSSLAVELPVPGVRTIPSLNVTLKIASPVADFDEWMGFVLNQTTMKVTQFILSGAELVLQTATFSATSHRWLRVSESGGVLYWHTSPDGATWTEFVAVTMGSRIAGDVIAWDPRAVGVSLLVATTGSAAATTTVSWDNVNSLVPSATGRPKVWTGGAWAQKPLKVWTGSAWVEKPVKQWTGSAWKKVT